MSEASAAAGWQVVEASGVQATAWRNGGGLTRELLRLSSGGAMAGGDGWLARISVADVEADGPFSPFPGVDRWFTVLSGAGVVLDWRSHDVAPARVMTPGSEPLCFDGDDPPGCRLLDGPTRDLNVMVRRDVGRARVEPARWDTPWNPGAPLGAGVFARVALQVHDGRGPGCILPACTLAWRERPPAGTWTIVPAGFAAGPKAQTGGSDAPPAWWIAVSAPRRPARSGPLPADP